MDKIKKGSYETLLAFTMHIWQDNHHQIRFVHIINFSEQAVKFFREAIFHIPISPTWGQCFSLVKRLISQR